MVNAKRSFPLYRFFTNILSAMKMNSVFAGCLFLLLFIACQNTPQVPPAPTPTAVKAAKSPQSPDVLYGELFAAVQMARIFPDGKTFVDCTPKGRPEDILNQYLAEKNKPGFDLKTFVSTHFQEPVSPNSGYKSNPDQDLADHINELWPILTRPADTAVPGSTLLPLPHPYVVPGGRFREVYYWDTYFTMLGLQSAGRRDLIHGMVQNFAFLIDTYGHIPNGNRSYYLDRSQPPFFSMMVQLLDESKNGDNEDALSLYLPQMEKEYNFWMAGADSLSARMPAYRRVVRLDSATVLNRYWDDRPVPRPESYREDLLTQKAASGRPAEEMYRHLKAGAESGWDFSSRWNVGKDLTGINTTDVIPVDLNCLMYRMEKNLETAWQHRGDPVKSRFYAQRAEARASAIKTLCFNEKSGWFEDYNWVKRQKTGVLSMAGMYPLFVQIATQQEADACAKTLEKKFLKPGGLVTTLSRTGQQWDAPNGWAPLQWVGIAGLRNYGHNELADEAKKRWIALCGKVYKGTGKLLEKYNVEDLTLDAGGGEYPVQDGFGWTNGVLLRLLKE